MILGLLQTFNGQVYIKKCLTSLSIACDEIYVLDDGSTDDTPKILADRKAWPKIKFVTTMPPQKEEWTSGDDFTRNMMLRMADRRKPTYCLSLDDDEELEDPLAVRNTILTTKPSVMIFGLIHLWDREDRARARYIANGRPLDRLRAWRWKRGDVVQDRYLHGGPGPKRPPEDHVLRLDLRIIHWGLFKKEDREYKLRMYERVDPEGRHNPGGYRSIVQPVLIEPFRRVCPPAVYNPEENSHE